MRVLSTVALAAILSSSAAYAQEGTRGAGRIEVSAFPGGGVFFLSSSDNTEVDFTNYTLGASFTWNANRYFGLEGEVGTALGVRQDVRFNGVTFASQASPSFLGFTGNAVVSPWGNDHMVVPYATGGIGTLRMLDSDDVTILGIVQPTNYTTLNVGGGVKFFASRHWGVRADYRFMAVDSNSSAPAFFGRDERRYAHRLYGGLLFTY